MTAADLLADESVSSDAFRASSMLCLLPAPVVPLGSGPIEFGYGLLA
jgi:hypothetical protein